MLEFHCLDPNRLETFLQRRRARPNFPLELSLAENLVELLRKANEFVPSSAGSILLDDPYLKLHESGENTLTFIAAFGDKAESLVGQSIPCDRGIAGHVYLTGNAYSTLRAQEDRHFYADMDRETEYQTHSMVAIPIRIEREVCGVLELINREGDTDFTNQEQNLLEIFAGYISIAIQNVLDGRQAQEIAKRDNLTGLFNDRYLHIILAQTIEECRTSDRDLAVLFLDLDLFKRVNDTHGHLAGSQVLREVGQLLGQHSQAKGAIAARYGGDEFVLLYPDQNLSQAVELAEDVRTGIHDAVYCSRPGEIQPDPLYLNNITCSVGVATLARHIDGKPPLDVAKSSLLRLADAAMYVAKETGRNRTAVAGEPVRRRE